MSIFKNDFHFIIRSLPCAFNSASMDYWLPWIIAGVVTVCIFLLVAFCHMEQRKGKLEAAKQMLSR